ncbi:MAG: NADH:ubiquinone reductase (Na(+)-transporting) subunit D [Firmicutes bacterium]|nr:NADH:ubiquinone reductase (Na(+)-transporting) subunit D [Bacillota bacterium]
MIKGSEIKALMWRNLWDENQVLRQILGICSLLAVTNLLANSVVMGLGLVFSVALSSLTISLLRNYIPHRVRMIVQTLIIAAWVILFDIIIKATLPEISRSLGPYVGLIITNCIIMGRAEAFAQLNPPLLSFLDGIFAGLGYTIVLVFIAFIREVLGFGTVFGLNVNFLGLETWTIMVMPPAAFFIIGVMIWVVNNIVVRKAVGGGKNG